MGLVTYFILYPSCWLYHLHSTRSNVERRKIFQWEGIKKVGLDHLIEQQKKDVLDANFRFRSNTVDENRDLIYMHLMNNDAILTKENHIDIFTDGEKKFNQLLTDIRNAKTFIHIQYYIFRYDGIGKEIIDALTEKAKEGVRVRLLYDDLDLDPCEKNT